MKTVNIALLGFGTVGSGVYEAIRQNNDKYEKTLGLRLEIKKILVSNINKKRDIDTALLTDNIDEAITDDIDIVIEVMGGIDFAKKCILTAFSKGKSVVSANKDLIANFGKELYEAADKNKVFFIIKKTTQSTAVGVDCVVISQNIRVQWYRCANSCGAPHRR